MPPLLVAAPTVNGSSSSSTTTATCRPLLKHADIPLVDRRLRIIFLATAKGGSSTACQIMYALDGQLQQARAYKTPHVTNVWWPNVAEYWEHNYREEVFNKQPDHDLNHLFSKHNPMSGYRATCNAFACVKLLRWPITRAVSSYFYAMGDEGFIIGKNFHYMYKALLAHKNANETWRPDVQCYDRCYDPRKKGLSQSARKECSLRCSTFEGMIEGLEAAARDESSHHMRPFAAWDHVFPQSSSADHNPELRNATVYLPLETLKFSLRALQATLPNFTAMDSMVTRTSAKERSNGTGYVQQEHGLPIGLVGKDLARVPYADLMQHYPKGHSPPYHLFVKNASVHERLRCLFRRDLQLYEHACAQSILRSPACGGKCLPTQCKRFGAV